MISQSDPKEPNIDPQPATNNPDEAIETGQEVQESNDEKIDEDFPGYPHYPAKDDIINPGNDVERVEADVENLTRSNTITPDHLKSILGVPEMRPDFTETTDHEDEADINIAPPTDADVTAEDLMMLGDRDEDMDLGEDEELKARGWQPATGRDLDIPEADDNLEEITGDEDEENSYYSLGGDDKQHLRESDDQNNF